MQEYLSFVTIDVWTLIFTWGNLLILFFLMKKLLFVPVTNILNKRQQDVNDIYDNANTAKAEAQNLKSEYETRLASAENEADRLIKSAMHKAQLNEEIIINEAKVKADFIKKQAYEDIELEKQNAANELKNDISDMAVTLASKIIERDLDESAHHEMIKKFIDCAGEAL